MNAEMKVLTDEIIRKSLLAGAKAGLVIGIIALVIGGVILFINIRKTKQNKALRASGEIVPKGKAIAASIRAIVAMLFLTWGIAFTLGSVKNISAAGDFTVSKQTIISKDKDVQVVRKKGKKRNKTTCYFTFSELGRKKVAQTRYNKFEEGDELYLILDGGSIVKIYDASEYTYQP